MKEPDPAAVLCALKILPDLNRVRSFTIPQLVALGIEVERARAVLHVRQQPYQSIHGHDVCADELDRGEHWA